MKHHRRRSKKPPVERVLCSKTGKREYEHYDDAVHVALKRSRRAGPLLRESLAASRVFAGQSGFGGVVAKLGQ
ncbi:hypothetical protein CBI45_11830 [Corynebacterium kefirresidentii]|nr:hypothetical protein CBI45_11830 [Corynebacterium kefirresidentii]